MGYWPRVDHIHTNKDALEGIRLALEERTVYRIEVAKDEDIYKKRFYLRTVLKACSAFPDELAGRYAGLDDRVKVAIDASRRELLVYPKGMSIKSTIEVMKPSVESAPIEPDFLEELKRAEAAVKPPGGSFMDKLKRGLPHPTDDR